MSETLHGKVLRTTGGFVDVATERGVLRCRLRGRLKQRAMRTDLCVAGDEVLVLPESAPANATGGGESPARSRGTIEEVLPRTSRIGRVHPARSGPPREDVLVANVDQLVVCVAYGEPPLRPRFIDRFLVIAEHDHVPALIVVNKADFLEEAEIQRPLVEPYRDLGYEVLETSAHTGLGVEALRARLEGKVSAICGPSGAGKSSLCNAIEPGLATAVGATSEAHGKGRHTTRVATLHPLAGGGYLADTPGIRELAAYGIAPDALARCFPELRPLLGRCAYRSCRHDAEPSCAVRAAVEAGQVSEERYDSYLRLLLGDERPDRVTG
jgi:ribosome biogenesis GTPase